MLQKLLIVLVAMFGFSGSLMASESEDKVRDALARIVPGMEPDSIAFSDLPGFYEVTYGADILYVTENGRYLLSGNLVDLASGENLTENKRAAGRLKRIAEIDESSMIVFSPKEVKHTITVFTDIDCTYCRKLHSEMEQYLEKGIEIRYLAFPRAGLNSRSYGKAVTVWCSEDRKHAMTEAKAGRMPDAVNCEHPIKQHMAVVDQLGLTGTPALVLEDGQLVSGYVPAERLEGILRSVE